MRTDPKVRIGACRDISQPSPAQFSTAQTSLEMLKEMDEAAASAASPEEDKSDSK